MTSKEWGTLGRLACPAGALAALLLLSILPASYLGAARGDPPPPVFQEVSVHDPSVVRFNGTFHIFGSHMAAARSNDLMSWTAMPSPFTAPDQELAEALEWSSRPGSNAAHWAPDVVQLDDGRFYFYYCTGNLAGPWGYLGLAVSDQVGGPYSNLGLIRRSGESGFNANIHPNSVDPHAFFDQDGRLWMVYGSYSGGIFIFEMDRQTGFPLPNQGWGTHLTGRNHSRIEAPYILYSPETDYYYLFLSFGGLSSDGGYNMRVARSRHPAGPYHDAAGTDMRTVHGPAGSFFDDAAIEPHGVKLAGNFRFRHFDGEPRTTSTGYRSPGHNSAYYDEATGKYFNLFHSRFVGTGMHPEANRVRVHQMYMNEDNWLMMAPHRYGGETLRRYTVADIVGRYKYINHGKAITANVVESQVIRLLSDGTIFGAAQGSWSLKGDNLAELTIDGTRFRGVFSRQWDHDNRVWVPAFTALSGDGVAIWGSRVALPESPVAIAAIPEQILRYGDTLSVSTITSPADSDLVFSLVSAPHGMTIDSDTGDIRWTPLLTQTGQSTAVQVRVEGDGFINEESFTVTVAPVGNLSRLDRDFSEIGVNGIRDGDGRATGFTHRLPGTGYSRPSHDTDLSLNTEQGHLAITSTRSDYNGQIGMNDNGSIGIALASLGFTGSEDFAVSATFRPLPALQNVDQAGVFIGRNSGALTRAGVIVFSDAPLPFAVHTENGSDRNGRFGGSGFDGTDGMTVLITREAGIWRYFVDGAEWNPMSGEQKEEPAFLDGHGDLIAGVFAINPLNDTPKTVELDSFSALVVNGDTALTQIEAWRNTHFGSPDPAGSAANLSDANGNGIPNLLEYALGRDPVSSDAGAPIVIVPSGTPARLSISFHRIADPFLTYQVQAASDLSGDWTTIWSSTGAANTEGITTVEDATGVSTGNSRFLRLTVSY